ncbi:MAG: DUF1579 domain-containing protein [Planctomycetota bacterium]
MKSLITTTLMLVFVIANAATTTAQLPTATAEHKIFEMEEGDWDAAITMFMGPAGPFDPPQQSKGRESNRMIGDFWIVSDFSGNFEGLAFTGQGRFGYDVEQKKYVGSWIDSMSPHATKMIGTYDAATKTMTYETTGVGMGGVPTKGKNVVVYGDQDRTMTMYITAPGSDEMIKAMEIVYTKAH